MNAPIIALPARDRPGMPQRLVCPACSERLGVDHRPRVQIRPQHALLLASGAVILENPTLLCATCLGRGVETVL